MPLDKSQESVVFHDRGDLLVIAGAGSGKTSSLTARIAHKIEQGVHPSRILALTFTVKAAEEMKQRVLEKLPFTEGMPEPKIMNWHSFGYKLMKKNSRLMGVSPDFSIISPDEEKRWVQTTIAGKLPQGKQSPAYNDILSVWYSLDEHDVNYPDIQRIKKEYQAYKDLNNLVNFDDLIEKPLHLLQINNEFRNTLRSHLDYVFVDEAQDNSLEQYELLKCVAGDPRIITTMVADDDQCIYQWRGAHSDILKAYIHDFNADLLKLENNYRSVPDIVNAASSLIQNNVKRIDKTPRSTRDDTNNKGIVFSKHKTGGLMAYNIAQDIETAINSGKEPSDLAVLYRSNKMSNSIERALLSKNIPYVIRGDINILDKQEGLMVRSILRAALNPQDGLAFKRMNELMIGVGVASLQSVIDDLQKNKITNDYEINYSQNDNDSAPDLFSAPHYLDNMPSDDGFHSFDEPSGSTQEEGNNDMPPSFDEPPPMDDSSFYDGQISGDNWNSYEGLEQLEGAQENEVQTQDNNLVYRAREQLSERQLIGAKPVLDMLDTLREDGPNTLVTKLVSLPIFKQWLVGLSTKSEGVPAITLNEKGTVEGAHYKKGGAPVKAADVKTLNRAIKDRIAVVNTLHTMLKDIDSWDEAQELFLGADNEKKANKVTLSTVHSAKGLEWDEVWIPGFSEGIMPNPMGEIEEERNVAYVALTRGKEMVHLHHADSINFYQGKGFESFSKSSFLAELELNKVRENNAGYEPE